MQSIGLLLTQPRLSSQPREWDGAGKTQFTRVQFTVATQATCWHAGLSGVSIPSSGPNVPHPGHTFLFPGLLSFIPSFSYCALCPGLLSLTLVIVSSAQACCPKAWTFLPFQACWPSPLVILTSPPACCSSPLVIVPSAQVCYPSPLVILTSPQACCPSLLVILTSTQACCPSPWSSSPLPTSAVLYPGHFALYPGLLSLTPGHPHLSPGLLSFTLVILTSPQACCPSSWSFFTPQ